MQLTLIQLERGKLAEVRQVVGGIGFQRRASSMGIRVGKRIQKVAEQPLRGPIVLEVEGCRIALGRGMAAKILVEEVAE